MSSHLRDLREELGSGFRGISDEQFSFRVGDKWSVGEILEHLYLTYSGSVKGFQKCLDAGEPLGRALKRKEQVAQWIVIGFGYLPEGRKSPGAVVPKGMNPAQVKSEILARIDEMDGLIGECEKRFGGKRLLDHPILGPLNGEQWRKFHLVHGRHHIKQIDRLRK